MKKRKLKNHLQNDIPNTPSHFHISDSNLLQYEFHYIVIKFYHKISLIFLNMPAKLILRIRNFVKMRGNPWKIPCSLPTLLKILVFHNFFPKFSGNCILRTSIFEQKPKSVYYVDFYELKTTRWLPNIWQAIPHFPKK